MDILIQELFTFQRKDQKKKDKKLAIMDQDGFNTKYLTLGNELVLTPRFNPTNQMVTYLSYFKKIFLGYTYLISKQEFRKLLEIFLE